MKKGSSNHIIILAFSITLLLFFSTCKKYDEDGKYSWKRPYDRVHNSWMLKEYLVNGNDSVNRWYNINNTINGNVYWQMVDARFNFTDYTQKDYQNTVGKVIDIYLKNVKINGVDGCPACYLHTGCDWDLKDKNSIVSFNTLDQYMDSTSKKMIDYSIINRARDDIWEIKKLTDKEMVLEAYSSTNKQLRLKFQR